MTSSRLIVSQATFVCETRSRHNNTITCSRIREQLGAHLEASETDTQWWSELCHERPHGFHLVPRQVSRPDNDAEPLAAQHGSTSRHWLLPSYSG